MVSEVSEESAVILASYPGLPILHVKNWEGLEDSVMQLYAGQRSYISFPCYYCKYMAVTWGVFIWELLRKISRVRDLVFLYNYVT